jgi:hypothetical protein
MAGHTLLTTLVRRRSVPYEEKCGYWSSVFEIDRTKVIGFRFTRVFMRPRAIELATTILTSMCKTGCDKSRGTRNSRRDLI